MALTGKQQAFVIEYIRCRNATEAARRAGYGDAGAYQRGYENMRHPEIAKAIEQHFAESAMTGGEVLALFAEQARAEYSEYFTVDAAMNPVVDVARLLADGKGHLIKSIKPTRWGVNVEFHDPVAAREIIAKVHGLLERGGSEEEPQHTVQWTVEEWKAEQERRRQQAAETAAMFDDDE
jgi:hypothetical protein